MLFVPPFLQRPMLTLEVLFEQQPDTADRLLFRLLPLGVPKVFYTVCISLKNLVSFPRIYLFILIAPWRLVPQLY